MHAAKKIRVEPIAVVPTNDELCGIFLGDGHKCILLYVDVAVGAAINAKLSESKPLRPLTHDLMRHMMQTFGAEMREVVVIEKADDVFFSRIIFTAENEIMERKIVEIDSRPSDAIALALRCKAPIYVLKHLWDNETDSSDLLQRLRDEQASAEDLV